MVKRVRFKGFDEPDDYLLDLCRSLHRFAPRLKPTEAMLVKLVEAQLNSEGNDVTVTISQQEAAAWIDLLAKLIVRKEKNQPLTTVEF